MTTTRASKSGTALKRIGVTLIVTGVLLQLAAAQLNSLIGMPIRGWLLLLLMYLSFLMIPGGAFLFWRGRQYLAKGDTKSIVTDSNPDVLYLRSFRSDTSTARYVFWSIGLQFATWEEELRDVLRPIGDLVAIGKPGEYLPTPGAARIYVSDEEWKEEVKLWMRAARLVVIRAGVGENLLWEAKHALETLNPQKLLILVLNMKPKDYESFRTKVNPLLGVSLPEGATLPRLWRRVSGFIGFAADWILWRRVSGFIGFAADWKPSFFPLRAPFFRRSLFNPYRAYFKFALRPVFERFGLEWQPPPVSLALVLSIAVPALLTLLISLLLGRL